MRCKKCGYKGLREQPIMELYNKNGEFVEGYGHAAVMIQTDTYYVCEGCGFDQRKPLLKVLPNPHC